MNATCLSRIRQTYANGIVDAVILKVPEPVPPSEHLIKYRLVYIVNGLRMVGYDNERGKGDHKHIGENEYP